MEEKRYPIHKAAWYVLISVLAVQAIIGACYFSYRAILNERMNDERYNIVALVGRCRSGPAVNPVFLAELLDLSCDKPHNLYAFDKEAFKERLKNLGPFAHCKLSLVRPGVAVVDYDLRTPFAILLDFENRAIDESGHHLFPLHPFYTPKRLPELYLGKPTGNNVQMAFSLLKQVQTIVKDGYFVKRIDISHLVNRMPNREMIVVLEDDATHDWYYLRLSQTKFEENLTQFLAIKEQVKQLANNFGVDPAKRAHIIDFRADQIALFRTVEKCDTKV